jgi:hypothetical protein
MPFFQVLITFPGGRQQDDIALRRDSAEDARQYVNLRAEEWQDKPATIRLRRISEATARGIVQAGGVDWAGV